MDGFAPLKVKRIRIEVGAERPFRAFHLSDTHIARADASEKDPRKVDLAAQRSTFLANGEHYLCEAVHQARAEKALLLHTGDMIDGWGGRHDFPEGQEWRDRAVQQRPDAATKEFVKYLKAQPLVKAVLTGHCHEYWEERLSPTAIQYTASATYKGECTAIDFV